MATLDRFSLAAEPFACGVLATDGLGLRWQLKNEGSANVCVWWKIKERTAWKSYRFFGRARMDLRVQLTTYIVTVHCHLQTLPLLPLFVYAVQFTHIK